MLKPAGKHESLTGKLLLSTALVAVTLGYYWWQQTSPPARTGGGASRRCRCRRRPRLSVNARSPRQRPHR